MLLFELNGRSAVLLTLERPVGELAGVLECLHPACGRSRPYLVPNPLRDEQVTDFLGGHDCKGTKHEPPTTSR